MFAKKIHSILILTVFGFTSGLTASSNLPPENRIYYPTIVKSIPNIGAVVTKRDNNALTGKHFISGYVINWSNEPFYGTMLEVDIVHDPYCDPGEDCDPYIEQDLFHPAFITTLPGQINPFYYEIYCYEDCSIYFNVRVFDATHDPPFNTRQFPLTVVSWDFTIDRDIYDDMVVTITGSIRNDTDKTLTNLKVVYFNLENCDWSEAGIYDEFLYPGRRTKFGAEQMFKNFQHCLNDNFVFVGQGETMPQSGGGNNVCNHMTFIILKKIIGQKDNEYFFHIVPASRWD